MLQIPALIPPVSHASLPHLQAQSLHVEGTLSSVFSAAPPCNTTGKLFIEAGFKGRKGASFSEVIMLLSETERTALCLWSSTLQCVFTFLNLHHLGKVNNGNEGVNCLCCSHGRGLKPKSSLSATRRRILVLFWKVRFR